MTEQTDFTPGPQGPKGIQGPEGLRGPEGLSLPTEVYEDCLAQIRQDFIEDDKRRANTWWRRLGRALHRIFTEGVKP